MGRPPAEPAAVRQDLEDGPEWKAIYKERQSVEQIIKSLKQSRRLAQYYVRRLAGIRLQALTSMLAHQATVLVQARRRQTGTMRWQVRRVA